MRSKLKKTIKMVVNRYLTVKHRLEVIEERGEENLAYPKEHWEGRKLALGYLLDDLEGEFQYKHIEIEASEK